MKRTPPLKQRTTIDTKQSNSIRYRLWFTRGLALGLILLAALIVLTGKRLHGQERDDALFIDESGNVTVGKKLDVKEGISAAGTVKAKKFEGDASALVVGGVEFVKEVKGNLPLTLEEIVRAVIADMVPIGTIMAYGGDVRKPEIKTKLLDQGWLPCDGGKIEVSKYKNLYDIIGNAFGGDGKSFYLPDMRGRFLRGVDYLKENEKREFRDQDANERRHPISGKKAGGVVGSVQEDQIKAHSHQYTSPIRWWDKKSNAMMIGKNVTTRQTWETASFGGKETRPKNIYVNWIIKAKHIIR